MSKALRTFVHILLCAYFYIPTFAYKNLFQWDSMPKNWYVLVWIIACYAVSILYPYTSILLSFYSSVMTAVFKVTFFCWIHQIEFLLHLLLDSIYYLLSSWRIVVREGGVAVAWHSSYFLVQCFIVQYGCMHICFFFGIELESVRRFLWFLLRFWV